MSISNQELFQIDLINSYIQNRSFLSPQALEQLTTQLAEFESGQTLDRNLDHFGDIYDDIQGFVLSTNNRYYRYDIQGFEPIKYLEFDSASNLQSLYLDCRPVVDQSQDYRKLSFIVQLNTDYTGGEFEMFRTIDKYSTVAKVAGGLVVYPSFTPYRLIPVQQGKRKILQGYIYGPQFR